MTYNFRKTFPAFFYAFFTILFLTFIFFSGCGGGEGGGSASEVLPTKMLSWAPPTSYSDGTPLDPAGDLDRFEVYVNEAGSFSDNDHEMAAVSAVNPTTGQIATSFDLANLSPFISKGIQYYVSMRAVGKNGVKSGFSPSASFSY